MTVTVKAMDSQRWICRTHVFQFNGTSPDSWDPRKQVDELPAHHLPAVTRAAGFPPGEGDATGARTVTLALRASLF